MRATPTSNRSLKANAAQVLRDLVANQTPLVIDQNGEAAVLQDVRSFGKKSYGAAEDFGSGERADCAASVPPQPRRLAKCKNRDKAASKLRRNTKQHTVPLTDPCRSAGAGRPHRRGTMRAAKAMQYSTNLEACIPSATSRDAGCRPRTQCRNPHYREKFPSLAA
jgi:hypothetical protein